MEQRLVSNIFERHLISISNSCILGKLLHVINFTFTLLDEGEKAYLYEGNHPLAVFRAPESYASLMKSLRDDISEVEQLQKTTVDEDTCTFEMEYFLGGDWKFLALVTGRYHM